MKLSTAARVVAGAALGTGLVALAPPSDAPAATVSTVSSTTSTAAGPARTTTALRENCWKGNPDPIRGARMEYYECRRDMPGTQQTFIYLRVKDTRADGRCAVARGAIGYSWDRHSVRTRVKVRSCTPGRWSAWRTSDWWNGNQGYEYVYLRRR
ncbi:hypothetical protein [Actinomadura miaoliensis]|uniref:Subtilisin inhibitor domain-containing protein n=1 Tax=Actinomadura miaoliensis TaxID=430685 RepID=A0ABP7V492_9ACTN